MQLIVLSYIKWCYKSRFILERWFVLNREVVFIKRKKEGTPIEMQTSASNGLRVTHCRTSSGNPKRFCSLAAVCYHPAMLSNQSHGAHRSCFKEVFCCLWRQLRKGLFIANLRNFPFGPCTEPTQNVFMQRFNFLRVSG